MAGSGTFWRVALRVFGLTGGIGSGKSTVARRLRERGLPVVNADELARVAVLPGSDALRQLIAHFGPKILDAEGGLDRAKLGRIVFADPEARRVLDAITHPVVRALARNHFAELAERGEPLACYEVPLLYEVGLEGTYRPVIVVNASDELRRARLTARDGLGIEQIEARIAAQLPLAEKVRRADYVIENDATVAELEAQTDAVFDALCRSLALDSERYPKPELR
ncbi:MAG TPA: dephospho-CoA kinase [Polyangiaceae bacterium]|jgi:dephospho-CoA kinase|nr:dephospho-CoA kinase [Polyangiaceae bacterium]